MYSKLLKAMLAVISGLLLFPIESTAQSFDFVSFDVPCNECVGGTMPYTVGVGINSSGVIVGAFLDAKGTQHGFVLQDGKFTIIDVPGAVSSNVRGIGPRGELVGNYVAPVSDAPPDSPGYCPQAGSTACIKGYVYSHGEFSTVLVPGHYGSIAQRISPNGDIYGCLHDLDMMDSMYGFARLRRHHREDVNADGNLAGDYRHRRARFTYTTLEADGGELADPTEAVPNSMHTGVTPDGETVVGLYTDKDGNTHGYLIQDGVLIPYDVGVPGATGTQIWDINRFGDFVGFYSTSSGSHSFLQPADGSPAILLNYPDGHNTVAEGIDPDSQTVVGRYTDAKGTHGFVAAPASVGGNDEH